MGKISQYTQALAAKLTDLFVVAQDDNGTLTTKSVSGSQLVELVQDNTTASDLPLTENDSTTVKEAIDEKATVYEIGDINTSTKTITFSTTVRFLLFSTGGSNARLSTHLCIGRASTSFTQPLLNGSVVTVSANNNTITITTTADNVRFHMLLLNGKIDDFVIT